MPPVGDPLPVPPPLLDLCKVPRERGHRAAEEDGGGGGAGGGGGEHLGHGQGEVHSEHCGREKHLFKYGFRFVVNSRRDTGFMSFHSNLVFNLYDVFFDFTKPNLLNSVGKNALHHECR